MRRTATALAILATSAACGGGGGSSPTTPVAPVPTPTPPPLFEVFDGIAGHTLTPRTVTPANPSVGDRVTIELDGYLVREQPWAGPRIALWPIPTQEASESALLAMVYGAERDRNLTRWEPGSYEAALEVPPGTGAKGEDARSVLEEGFNEIAAAGGPVFSWSGSGEPPDLEIPGGVDLKITVSGEDECLAGVTVACATWWREGGTIVRAELVFERVRYAADRRMAKHMLGLLIGLGRHRSSGLMAERYHDRNEGFRGFEQATIHMMYLHRKPGNAPPDRDPGFTAAGGSGRERHVELPPGS